MTATEAATQLTDAEANRALLECAWQVASAFVPFCLVGAALAFLMIAGIEVVIRNSRRNPR